MFETALVQKLTVQSFQLPTDHRPGTTTSEALPRTDGSCLVGNRKGGVSTPPHAEPGDPRLYRLRKNSSGQALSATTARAGAARFGVRQLAAAFLPASLLAGIATESIIARQQAGSSQSGSKLPHSKASLRMTAETSFSAACEAPPFPWNWTRN